ncbi:MAG TPA: CPBP family intramembrane glutamic endopeptidase [Pseudomonadales bacterium]|nr:CPBP family intramembrane glutamic endopeptidase [Pseudomonadales bacterium]
MIEALAVLAVTLPVALLTQQSSLWFLVPFVLITLSRRDYAEFGLDLSPSARARWGSAAFHAATVVAVFVPYAIGHYLLARWFLGRHFTFQLPESPLSLLIDQLLGVGLPEEFFFRGYLQTQLNRSFGRPWQIFGARWGAGLPLAAALFALCHVPLGGAGQLIVFFPGLFYGWLRERTDGVVVPTIYHAVSNILLKTILVSLH